MNVTAILVAVEALVEEAKRRSRGEAPDQRFDIPLLMLADLADELAILTGAAAS